MKFFANVLVLLAMMIITYVNAAPGYGALRNDVKTDKTEAEIVPPLHRNNDTNCGPICTNPCMEAGGKICPQYCVMKYLC